MTRAVHIAQIGDLHLRPGGGVSEFGVPTESETLALLDALQNLSFDIDAIVVTGDLADADCNAAYPALQALFRKLALPVFVVPGNTDDRVELARAFPLPASAPASTKYHYSCIKFPVDLIFLDSSLHDSHSGGLGDAQLRWLDEALSETPGKPAALFLHHPPITVGLEDMDKANLQDAAAFAAVLQKHANVLHIACGHLHRPVFSSFANIPLSIAPSPNLSVDLRLDESDGFSMSVEHAGFHVHRWTAVPGSFGNWTVHCVALRQRQEHAPLLDKRHD